MVGDDWDDTDPAKVSIAPEIADQFKCLPLLVNHARGLLKQFSADDKAHVFRYCKGVPVVAVVVWCMLK